MRLLACALLAVSVVLAGCGGGQAASSGPAAGTVTMQGTAYLPPTLSLKVGDTVEWVWADGLVPHNIDGASEHSDFDSGNPKTAGTWRYTFRKAGTYDYHCDVHPAMMGTVVVS